MPKKNLLSIIVKIRNKKKKYEILIEIFRNILESIKNSEEIGMFDCETDLKTELEKISNNAAEVLQLKVSRDDVISIEIEIENYEWPWYAQNVSEVEMDLCRDINEAYQKGIMYNCNVLGGVENLLTIAGGVKAAKKILFNNPTTGFKKLCISGKPELTIEAIILRPEYNDILSPEDKLEARKRLKEFGYIF